MLSSYSQLASLRISHRTGPKSCESVRHRCRACLAALTSRHWEAEDTHPRITSKAITLIQPGRVAPYSPVPAPSPSSATILMKCMRNTSDSVGSSVENCLRRRNTTRVQRSVSANIGRSEVALSSNGHRRCCNRSRSSGCWRTVRR